MSLKPSLLALLACAACVSSNTHLCADGRVCPAAEVCDEVHHRCVLPQQLSACAGVADGVPCEITAQLDGLCRDQVCLAVGCGDGVIVAPEECDDVIPAELDDCTEHGFHTPGPVRCSPSCAIDTAQCGARCGDGVLDPAEQCDPGGSVAPDDDVMPDLDCLAFGFYAAGGLRCSPACTIDVAACSGYCGDGVRNGGEACDGGQLGSVDDCTDLGFYATGTVTCDGGCNYDTAACTGFCGDGVINGDEPCDPGPTSALTDDVLGGQTCQDFNFHQPAGLACSAACTVVTAGCSSRCGDGILDPGEDCDAAGTANPGDDVFAGDCRDLGFYEADVIKCTAACTYDTRSCKGSCGDRILDPVEACEGRPPEGMSCLDFGFDEGPLGCTPRCAPDLSKCRRDWSATRTNAIELTGVWGDGSDMFAVGYAGMIVRGGGATWTAMSSGTTETLHDIHGTSSSHALVVGSGGTILRWNGAAWTPQTSGTTVALYGVWAASTTVAFAVGAQGMILRWDGSTWSPSSSGTTVDLLDVWGSAEDNAYAVGASGTILKWNGSAWSPMSSTTTNALHSVWGSSASDVWAVGDFGAVVRSDGVTWSSAGYGAFDYLRDVWGRSATDVFAVGWYGNVMHYNGVRWIRLRPYSADTLTAVWGDRDQLTIVGGSGLLQTGTGRRWRQDQVTASGQYTAIWGSGPGDITAVGNNGVMAASGTSTWDPVSSGSSAQLGGIWGSGPSDVFAVGWGEILHRDATTWTPMTVGTYIAAEAVSGSGPTDVLAVGFAGTILHYDGTWLPMTSGTDAALFGVASTAPGEAYAVGADGTILQRSGTSWAAMTSGTSEELTSVWASGPRDIFAVGARGVALHCDGTSWSPLASPLADNLSSVWGTGPEEVYAASYAGTIMRWDGTSWSPMRSPIITQLRGVWAGPGSYVHAAGANTNILTLPRSCAAAETDCSDGDDDDCDGRVDCSDTDCASACAAGGACAGWTAISCGATVTDSTVGGASRLDRYACGEWLELGRERVFQLVPDQSGTITVALTDLTADLDLAVLEANAAGACAPSFPGCLGVSSTTQDEAVTFTATADTPYFLVVDGYGASRGGFTLSVTCP